MTTMDKLDSNQKSAKELVFSYLFPLVDNFESLQRKRKEQEKQPENS